VQYLVLGYASRHEALTGNIGNLALLKVAAGLGLAPERAALESHDAYRRFRQLQHSLRLQGEPYARIDPDAVRSAADAVLDLWRAVLGDS
jgi:[glutamine synthetase] adenylyltransferase / [glutamine synthetase]-adenylyl-L-tyrosine phosphorylase